MLEVYDVVASSTGKPLRGARCLVVRSFIFSFLSSATMRLSGDLLMRAGTDRSDGVYPVLLSGSGGLGGSFTQVSNVDILEYDTTFGDVGHSLVSTTSRSCLGGVCRVVFFGIVSRVPLLCQPSKREVLVGTGSALNVLTSTDAFSFPASRWLRDGALALSLQGWSGGHLAVRKGLDRRRATRHDPGFYCHRRKGPCVAHEVGCGVAHFTVLPHFTQSYTSDPFAFTIGTTAAVDVGGGCVRRRWVFGAALDRLWIHLDRAAPSVCIGQSVRV